MHDGGTNLTNAVAVDQNFTGLDDSSSFDIKQPRSV